MRRASGFTLKELLIVIGAIGLIDCLLLMAIPRGRDRRQREARIWMNSLRAAIEQYHQQAGTYPPDTDLSGKLNASELLYKNLCLPVVLNGKTLGPFFYGGNTGETNGNGAPELHSHLGGAYEYKILRNAGGSERGFLVIDPGPDQKYGGKIDPQKGFVPEKISTDPNIITDDKDNIYSNAVSDFED